MPLAPASGFTSHPEIHGGPFSGIVIVRVEPSLSAIPFIATTPNRVDSLPDAGPM